MQKEEKRPWEPDMKFAAVCGLYCKACRWFIAAREDPERLKILAAEFGFSEEEARCSGCRSEKRIPYCESCKFFACAAGRGIDFCGECDEYPCGDLAAFQAERPHRIELWTNLARIRDAGCGQWLEEIRNHYTCPRCGTVNSAYDLECRKCGEEPSCAYVAEHRQAVEQYLKSR